MPLKSGMSLGSYKVLLAIGAGGMGEVYRARDTKLGRDVALKVLPAEVAQEPERLARFRREAQLLASLNHPHIGAIYGLEKTDESTFLVLELVEGEDLAERLKRGSLPLDETLALAGQIADALEEAHEKGIIHRDLKPSNIKVTPDGKLKVLDFGLAKAYAGDDVAGSSPDLSHSPTLARTGTVAGVILGTAAYMSPEQARAKVVDRRADIWAFGAVVFEMLTGKRLFTGETVTDVIAAVVKEEPRWEELPPETPPALRRLLQRCLQKDPKARLKHIGDARFEIEEALAAPREIDLSGPAKGPSRPLLRWLPWGVAAALLVANVLLGILWAVSAIREDPVVRASIPAPEGAVFHLSLANPGPVAVSPDGSRMAFSARDQDGQVRLFVRSLDAGTAHVLSGTEDARYPFWSPDGRSIGFFANGKLKKMEASGGPPLILCDAANGKGGSWNHEGVIVFAPGHDTPLHRVSDAGGESTPVTTLDPKNANSHRHPRFLPDGRHFLYLARTASAGEENTIRIGSLDGDEDKDLLRSAAAASYASDHVLFVRDRTLMARRFDTRRLEFPTEAIPVAQDVMLLPGAAHAVFSASENGVLVYLEGGHANEAKLEWFDRAGKIQGALGDTASYSELALSPDGRHAAVSILDPAKGTNDLWIYEIARNLRTRFTFDAGEELSPVWSPDGKNLVFTSNAKGHQDLYRKSVAGSGEQALILESEIDKFPSSWSPDGAFVVYNQSGEETRWDLWVVPVSDKGEPHALLQSPFSEVGAVVSPDGRWMTYNSNESGRWEVYVTTFPEPARKWQVSTDGGVYPFWRRDGKEILYQKLDGHIVAVEVDGGGESFEIGPAEALFEAAPPLAGNILYAPSPDADRFLVATQEAQTLNPLTLVMNWTAELNRK